MSKTSDRRLYFPHVARNRDPIFEVLRRVLPRHGLVLEIASGGGEHAAYFAKNLPGLRWQPTDANSEMFESIAAHRAAAGVANLLAPLRLDVTSEQWPVERGRRAGLLQHDPHRAVGRHRRPDRRRRANARARRSALSL